MADQGTEGKLSPFLRAQRVRAVGPYFRGRVLDVGCGSGVLAGIVPADRYLGVDLDEESITTARSQYPQHSFQSSLPPAEPVFDTVVALAVIEHVPDPAEFLADLTARLNPAPGNCIVCTTPHPAVKWIHTAGAQVGLFSRHAIEEHESSLNHSRLQAIAQECNLMLAVYKRFFFGANQLVVFQRIGGFS